VGIGEQTRLAMENIKTILDHQGLAWTDVVKVTKYLTDMRDMDGMVAVWR
jgi:2-aminomuconate deaminase